MPRSRIRIPCLTLLAITVTALITVPAGVLAQDELEEGLEDGELDAQGEGAEGDGVTPDPAADSEAGPPPLPSIKGRLRVGLELTLVDYESISMTVDDDTMTSFDREVGTIGLTNGAGLGLAGGYGLTDEFMLSASILLSHSSASFGGGDNTFDSFRLELTPGVEYLFAPGESFRPFAGGVLGFRLRSGPVGATDIDEFSLMPGIQGGAHVFLNDSLSIDGRLLLAYLFALSASSQGAFGPQDYSSANGPAVLLAGGLSYWW